MDWPALKSNECPACGSFLEVEDEDGMVRCENEDCEFKIRSTRLKEIVEQMDDEADFGYREPSIS